MPTGALISSRRRRKKDDPFAVDAITGAAPTVQRRGTDASRSFVADKLQKRPTSISEVVVRGKRPSAPVVAAFESTSPGRGWLAEREAPGKERFLASIEDSTPRVAQSRGPVGTAKGGFFGRLFESTGKVDRFAYALGKGAQAVMGEYGQETWQARLGGVGAEQAQSRAHSRYLKAIIAGEEPDTADVAILTPEQQWQGAQMQEAMTTRKSEEGFKATELELKQAELELKRKELATTVPTVEEQKKEKALERETKVEVAGIRADAIKYSTDQSLVRASLTAGRQLDKDESAAFMAKYRLALTEVNNVLPSEMELWGNARIKEVNRLMRARMGNEYVDLPEGIDEGGGKSADEELLGL